MENRNTGMFVSRYSFGLISRSGFTLVELIVVITILAILWTVGFVSLKSYSSSARDSNRLTTLSNIEKLLSIYSIKTWGYPEPDGALSYTGGTLTVVIRQWVIADSVVRSISLSTPPLDPLTNEKYVYSVSWNRQYYQVATERENLVSHVINAAYADSKSVMIRWNYVTDPSLPSLIAVSSTVNTGSWIFSPNVCFVMDGWKNTLESCVEKKSEMSLKEYDNTLVGYWDMETLSWAMLKDLSGNGNDWAFSGVTLPTKDFWLFGGSYYFWSGGTSNNLWFIQITNSNLFNDLPNGLTVSTLVKTSVCSPGSFIIIKTWPRVDAAGFQTGGVDYSNKIHWYNWWYYLPSNNCTNDNFSFYTVGQIPDISTNSYFVGSYVAQSWTPSGENTITNKSVLRDSKYHIMTSTMDGKWNTRKIYIDWIKLNEFTVPKNEQDTWIRRSIGDLFIGTNINNTNWVYSKSPNFNGVIDDVKVYNRVLSDSEIQQQARIAGF